MDVALIVNCVRESSGFVACSRCGQLFQRGEEYRFALVEVDDRPERACLHLYWCDAP